MQWYDLIHCWVHGSHGLGPFFPATVHYHQGHSNLKSSGGTSVKGWLMPCRSWNLRMLWWGEGKGNQEPNPSCATLAFCEIMVKQLKLSENQSVQLPLRSLFCWGCCWPQSVRTEIEQIQEELIETDIKKFAVCKGAGAGPHEKPGH